MGHYFLPRMLTPNRTITGKILEIREDSQKGSLVIIDSKMKMARQGRWRYSPRPAAKNASSAKPTPRNRLASSLDVYSLRWSPTGSISKKRDTSCGPESLLGVRQI